MDPWFRARNCYMEDLNEDEKRVFETASLKNLFDSTLAAQQDHEQNSKSRELSKKLKPLTDAILMYSEALDVYTNTYPLAIGPLWGSIRVLLRVKSNSNYFTSSLEQAYTDGSLKLDCRVIREVFPEHHQHAR